MRARIAAVLSAATASVLGALFLPAVVRDHWATLLIYATAATALNLVSGSAGQISLGHAALVGTGAYAAGWLAVTLSPEALITFPVAAVAGALVGLAFGAPSLRVSGQYLAVVTISGGFIFVRLISEMDAVGAEQGLIDIGFMSMAGRPLSADAHMWAAVALFIAAIWVAASVSYSHLGMRLAAIKDNETAAETSGIDVYKEKLFVFVASAVICAIAGALFAHKEGFISAAAFDLDLSLMLLLSCIVGGLGRPLGGSVGAALLMAPGLFISGTGSWELAAGGVVAIVTLFLMPDGVAGAVRRMRGRNGVGDLVTTAGTGHAPPSAMPPATLTATGIVRSFGGVRALDGVSVEVPPGKIHALIGPNGSGKTTLIDCLTGVLTPDEGRVMLGEDDITRLRSHRIAAHGVARTFQSTASLPSLSVLEAAALAVREPPGSMRLLLGAPARPYARAAAGAAAAAIVRVGLDVAHGSSSRSLSYGQARRLELARALASEPRLLILDEPAAGLDPVEIEFIAQLLRQLRDAGVGILLADHHMRFVLDVADEISVLDHGVLIAHGSPDQVRSDPEVIRAYLGEEVTT